MKYLILFLFSMTAHAGYMKKSEVENCNLKGRNNYSSRYECQKNGPCVRLPERYQCEYYELSGDILVVNEAKRLAFYAAKKDKKDELTAKKIKRTARRLRLKNCLFILSGSPTAAQVKSCRIDALKEQIRAELTSGEM